MKRFLSPFLALTILAAPNVFAEEAAPRYLNIFTAHVKLGHQAQYEAGIKNLWIALKEAGADFPVFASQSGDSPGDYNFVTALDSMADMDAQNAVFNKIGEQNPGVFAELGVHTTGNNTAIIALRPDLAYQPEEPRLAEGEAGFAYLTFLHTSAEHAQGVEDAIKAFSELSRKQGIRDGYGVSQNVTGEGPVYVIRTLAKSQADYFAHVEMNDEKLGEEAVAIRAKVGPMLKELSFSWGFGRPDLSYQP